MSAEVIRQSATPNANDQFRLFLLRGMFPLLLTSGSIRAQCEYAVEVIQPEACPIFGIPAIAAEGLSNTGHVVGWHLDCSFLDDEAFVWTAELGVFDLPIPSSAIGPRAVDVNSDGRVVGWVDLAGDGLGEITFVYENGTLANLGTLTGGNFSRAAAVNEPGQVVGRWGNFVTGDPTAASFLWQGGVLMDLTLPLGPNSAARDINDVGQIVGYMGESFNIDSHAFVWENGVVTDLGKAPGAIASEAKAINNAGQVVVQARFQKDKSSPLVVRSFIWDDGQWTDLGVLPGFTDTFVYDINDACQVVGVCKSSVGLRGFFWQAGMMIPVIDLIAPDNGSVSGIVVEAINDAGQIAGLGGYDNGQAAFLLTPIDRPSGDIDNDCTVGIGDLLQLLSAWGPCQGSPVPCAADVDGDAQVGVLDLLVMLSNWTV